MANDQPRQVSGVMPDLALAADLGPPRTECGVGALMPWAGRLWAVSYVSHKIGSGSGTGLYEIDADFHITKRPESYPGTYTNRFVHFESSRLFIGPHVIDADRTVHTIEEFFGVRVCSTFRHLREPERLVYALGMEGEFFEVDVRTLEVRQIADLTEVLGVSSHAAAHFKAGYCALGRVVVANNTYDEADVVAEGGDGRLAEWDGKRWTTLERTGFSEVTGRGEFAGTIFATGWDRASAIMKVYTRADDTWRTYRLPKGSHTYDHMWQTEWPRIRETEHERFLMDCHGIFYELSPWAYGNRVWGVLPICRHLWVLGDFCSWRGMLVLGADNASPHGGANCLVGEPQSGLWFGKTDDLWSFGKPAGWGGPWWDTPVAAGEPSDPYLMTGFEGKVLHLAHDAGEEMTFTVEVDFQGIGRWHEYACIPVARGGYAHHEFPPGFSAHWVRITPGAACTATAQLTYT
jgi:hypothetical protein